MTTDKDVADKKNGVKMLRLECDEMLIRQQLDRVKKETLGLDYTVVSQRIINKNLRRINTDQHKTINKLNALLADEKMTLAAYRNNPLSDQVADRDNRIEQLMVLNEALRIDMELAHNLSRDHIAGQDRFIEGVKTELDARNQVIKDFKAIEQKETDRLHTIIDEFRGSLLRSGIEKRKCETTIDELNSMYCDVCGKLERIEKIARPSVRGCVCTRESVCRTINEIIAIAEKSTPIDEITKIIQEE